MGSETGDFLYTETTGSDLGASSSNIHLVGEFRKGIIHGLRRLVDDMADDTQQRFDQLPNHVKMAYQRDHVITRFRSCYTC